MTLNDLECPIHLKVRFTDGTLDVRTLWLSDSTICTGITREGGGSGLEGQTLPLHPCGQLTRCFSAVAELLVLTTKLYGYNRGNYLNSAFFFVLPNVYPYSVVDYPLGRVGS